MNHTANPKRWPRCWAIGCIVVLITALLTTPFRSVAQEINEQQKRYFDSMGGLGAGQPKSFRDGTRAETNTNGMSGDDSSVYMRAMSAGEGTIAGVTYSVHVVGEVLRPGTYRVAASDRLQDLIQRSGGLTPRGSSRRIEIRNSTGGIRFFDLFRFQVKGDLRQNPYLLDNDTVFVPVKKSQIMVTGAVNRPETYELAGEKNLADAISLAGGTNHSFSQKAGITVVRYVNGEKTVLQAESHNAAQRKFGIQAGDVVFVPSVLNTRNTFDFNIENIPGNEQFYPSFEDRVFVLGGVNQPGPYQFSAYRSLRHYLSLAGGITKMALPKKIDVLRVSGKKETVNGIDSSITLNPGDTVFIPERRIAPESKVTLVLGLLSSIVSTTAATIALTR